MGVMQGDTRSSDYRSHSLLLSRVYAFLCRVWGSGVWIWRFSVHVFCVIRVQGRIFQIFYHKIENKHTKKNTQEPLGKPKQPFCPTVLGYWVPWIEA